MDRRVKERLIGATILVVLVVLIVPELLSGQKRPAAPAAPLIPAASSSAGPVRNVTVDLATSKATADESSGASPAASALSSPASAATAPTPGPSPAEERVRAADVPPAGPPTITTLRAQQPAASPADDAVVAPPKRTTREPAAGVPGAGQPAAANAAPATVTTTAGAAAPETTHRAWAVQLGSFASKANADALIRRLRGEKSQAYVSSIGTGRSVRYRVRIGPLADRAAAERMMVKLKKEGHAATLVVP